MLDTVWKSVVVAREHIIVEKQKFCTKQRTNQENIQEGTLARRKRNHSKQQPTNSPKFNEAIILGWSYSSQFIVIKIQRNCTNSQNKPFESQQEGGYEWTPKVIKRAHQQS
jgi:hypothetical protein